MADLPAPRTRYRSIVADSGRWDGFTFRPGDVVISTPPKCGTTWTQMLCALLIFDGSDFPALLSKVSPWLDMCTRPLVEVTAALAAQTHRRFIKTHTPLDGLPLHPDVTYLVVGRDPRDVAISFEHHTANLDVERFLELRAAAVGNEDLAELPEFSAPSEDPVERFRSFVTDETPGETRTLAVVLCNGGASAVREAIPRAFLELVTHGEPSQDWVSAIETSSAAALASILATSTPFPQGEPPADAAPPLPWDAYTGTFTNTTYGEVTVREEAGGLVLEFGLNGVRHRLFPWDRDAFSMPLTGADAAQIAQLGVLFTIGPEGQADTALVSLGGVGPDAAATFTRVAAGT